MNLATLAGLLGLSKTTVSRALAGYRDVSPATRARVQRAAEEYGYHPNPMAQGLRSGRTGAVGVVVPSDCGGFTSPFFLDVLISASQSLAERGLNLLLASAPRGEPELVALRRLVEERRVDAMIVAQTRRQDPRVCYLLEHDRPFVCHGRTEDERPYAFVDMDGEGAFHAAATRLIGLGHRRIAYIGAPSAVFTYAAHRKTGYLRALAEAGLEADPALILEGDGGEDFGREATAALLARRSPPTAFLCATDLEAVGALQAITAAGRVAGRDVSVIGHDDLPLTRYTDPPLTTIGQPYTAIGVRLVEMLVELMAGTPPERLQEIWHAEIVPRASDGPPRRRRSS